jgi:hypothetical protein
MSNADAAAASFARSFPGIADACETSAVVRARVEIEPGEWKVLQLYVIHDFSDLKINKVFPESGAWPPADGQILFERASLPVLNTTAGGKINVRTLSGAVTALAVAGTVFDPSQEPAWVNDITVGYITPGTLQLLGGQAPQAGLRITVNGTGDSRASITAEANRLAEALTQRGYGVQRVEVPIPGKYPQPPAHTRAFRPAVPVDELAYVRLACFIASFSGNTADRRNENAGGKHAANDGNLYERCNDPRDCGARHRRSAGRCRRAIRFGRRHGPAQFQCLQ